MRDGVQAGVDEAVEEHERRAVVDDLAQAGLFDELDAAITGDMGAPSPLGEVFTSRRRPGRPQGARSLKTRKTAEWLLTFNRHPVLVMMEYYACTPKELLKAIGLTDEECTPDRLIEALKFQARMAEVSALYVAQKQPQGVQLEGGAQLNVTFGGVDLSGGAGGVSIPARGEAGEISVADGMSVRLGQVGRQKSDDDATD